MRMSKEVKLAILIPYFGKWPFWINYFLMSCKWNPTVDWYLFTDCGEPLVRSNNVHIIDMTFDQYVELVSEQLNINFRPDKPYKLCDIKPMLGHIHEAWLKDYSHFAFGDLDVIYGNLRAYYTDQMLEKFKLISTFPKRVSGHLCIMQNTEEMRCLYQSVKGWRRLAESPSHCVFDEKHFSDLLVKRKNFPEWLRKLVTFHSSMIRNSRFQEDYSTPYCRPLWHDGTRNYPEVWYSSPGSLTNDKDGNREFPYLHFMYWKSEVWPKLPSNVCLDNVPLEDLDAGWKLTVDGFSSL